jgi:transcriptional regulator with XRE-family HTH domain
VTSTSTSEMIGRQVARARGRRGWTQQQLADELHTVEPATSLTRAAVAKIESGARGVSVDEVMLIAATLSVPPVLLLVPIESGDTVRLASTVEVTAWEALEWFLGWEPLGDVAAWSTHTAPLRAYERLLAAQDAAKTALYRIESAGVLGRKWEQQEVAYVEALRDLATALRDLRERGARSSPLVDPRLVQAIDVRGIDPRPRRTVRLSQED